MANLHLVAVIVDDYDSAIDFFVRILQFELIEDVPSTTIVGNRWDLLGPRLDGASI